MTEIIVITGATRTGKTRIAVNLAKKKAAVLLPLDQLQMYMHLKVGVGFDDKDLAGVRSFGYQILDPWKVFGPISYVSWLKSSILSFRETQPLIIEGGCTSYLRRLILEKQTDPVLNKIKVFALDPGFDTEQRLKTIECFYTLERVQAIIAEVRELRSKGFYDETGLDLFEQCERTFIHSEEEHRGLAWALRISARIYYPAHLASVFQISEDLARARIITNVFDIQEYQAKRIRTILDSQKIYNLEQTAQIEADILAAH